MKRLVNRYTLVAGGFCIVLAITNDDESRVTWMYFVQGALLVVWALWERRHVRSEQFDESEQAQGTIE